MVDVREPLLPRALSVRTTVAAAAALSTAILPVFLFAALSTQVGAELRFGERGVGAAVTVFFVTAGLSAVPGGRLTERLGAASTLRLGTLVSGVAVVGMGTAARAWWHVAVMLALAGTAVGLADTGAARALADRVRPARQGLAFGVKEASVPAASLLAGFAVPLLGLTVGWRPAFIAGVALVPVVWILLPQALAVPPPARPDPSRRAAPGARATLLLLSAGSALAAGAATASATFLVRAAVTAGVSPGAAGLVLALASAASIGVRLAMGWGADRSARPPIALVAWLMAGGVVGLLVLAVGGGAATVVGGGLVALGAGWGWTGLVFLSAVRADPWAPAAAAGIVLAGLSVGGAVGPLAFGALLGATSSYPAVWGATAVTMALGAAATAAAHLRAVR